MAEVFVTEKMREDYLDINLSELKKKDKTTTYTEAHSRAPSPFMLEKETIDEESLSHF